MPRFRILRYAIFQISNLGVSYSMDGRCVRKLPYQKGGISGFPRHPRLELIYVYISWIHKVLTRTRFVPAGAGIFYLNTL